MITCLNNYIGIKGCNQTAPSGLWINDLPGISTELSEKIANTEQKNFLGVWESVQKNAQMVLKNDIINIMSEKMNFNNILYQTRKPRKQTPNVLINAENKYKGVYIEAIRSKYVELNLKGIWLQNQSMATITTTLKVFDVNDGSELFSKEIEVNQGFQYVEISEVISQTYDELKLFVAVDVNELDTLQFIDGSYNLYDCNDTCTNVDGINIYFGSSEIQSEILYTDVQKSSVGSISIDAEINCSISDFICQNKKILQQPYWYQLGNQMLLFKLGSPKLNYFTSTNLENTNTLREEFLSQYRSSIKRVVDAIPLTGESLCFNCDDKLIMQNSDMMP